uniref:Uncharacterized protein n=1 Tax=Oryza barthii TaxID=65489 RepID=A0A0D3EKN2_9ORYZ
MPLGPHFISSISLQPGASSPVKKTGSAVVRGVERRQSCGSGSGGVEHRETFCGGDDADNAWRWWLRQLRRGGDYAFAAWAAVVWRWRYVQIGDGASLVAMSTSAGSGGRPPSANLTLQLKV